MGDVLFLDTLVGGEFALHYQVSKPARAETPAPTREPTPTPTPKPMPTPTPTPTPEPAKFTLVIEATLGGTTIPNPGTYQVSAGHTIQIQAFPSSGYEFVQWTGDQTGNLDALSLFIDRNMSIKANFGTIQMPVPLPSAARWQVGQVLRLTSGERWQILEMIIVGSTVNYRAKWLDTGNTSEISESTFVACGASAENAPTPPAVSVVLRAYNAPTNAVYWVAMCNKYQSAQLSPITQAISWIDVPPSTSQDEVIFNCYDASGNEISTPNGGRGVGFVTAFENGRTYYWDFARGLLLNESKGMM